MKRVAVWAVALAAVPAMAAADVYVPTSDWALSRSTLSADQVIAGDGWRSTWDGVDQNGFRIGWNITYDTETKLYDYTYKISGDGVLSDGSLEPLGKALSHWILEVSSDFETSDLIAPSPAPTAGPSLFEAKNGNPGMPDDIYGVKWDTTGDPTLYTATFKSERAPVWGDFYAKDGVGTNPVTGVKEDAYAYNAKFGASPDTLLTSAATEKVVNGTSYWYEGGAPFVGFIARPDTMRGPGDGSGDPGGVIPEPGTLLLLGSGLLGLASVTRRRR